MVDKNSDQKLNADVHEGLSALTDGELSSADLDQLLQRLQALPAAEREIALNKWAQFQSATQAKPNPEVDLTADIMATIRREPLPVIEPQGVSETVKAGERHLTMVSNNGVATHHGETAHQETHTGPLSESAPAEQGASSSSAHSPVWMQWAVAASVCFMVIMGWQLMQPASQETHLMANQSAVTTPVVAQAQLVREQSSRPSLAPQAQTVSTQQLKVARAPTAESIPVIDVAELSLERTSASLSEPARPDQLQANQYQANQYQANQYIGELIRQHGIQSRVNQSNQAVLPLFNVKHMRGQEGQTSGDVVVVKEGLYLYKSTQ